MSVDDVVFSVGEWLRTTPLTDLALGIQQTRLSVAIDSSVWIVAIIQTIHILAIGAVIGSVLMMNLRIVQLAGRYRTMTQTVRRYLPWVWSGLAVLLVTGIGLVFSDPVRNLTNPIFWTKMILVGIAAAVSLWFQGSVRRNATSWELTHDGRLLIRAGAIGVIGLWSLIVFAGRWIAYAPT